MAWFGQRRQSPEPVPDGDSLTTPAQRAHDAWRALRANCLFRHRELVFAKDGPGRSSTPAFLWPLSQVLAAAIDIAPLARERPDTDGHETNGDNGNSADLIEPMLRGLQRYAIGEAYGPSPGDRNRYYDDNAWIALDYLRLHELTGEDAHLAAARRIFGFLEEGEAAGGGVYWIERPKESIHTCSTGPSLQIALWLHRLTGDERFAAFARRSDAFLETTLRSAGGLYADNVRIGDGIDTTYWSYNQGTPIAADVLWLAITGDRSRLDHASITAHAALDHYGADGIWKQPAAFNGIFFRALLDLDAVQPDPRYQAALDDYLDRAWRVARDPGTGLLLAGDIGRYEGGGTIDHSALTQLYALRARRARSN